MGPLDGLRILEWGELITAPYCGKLAADLGAQVIKVELPGKGDQARWYPPFFQDVPGPDRSGLFLYLNTSKLGVTLDPATLAGREVFLDLVAQVDAVIENQPVGFPASVGLAYEDLRRVNEGVVVVSISPFGQTGPYRDYVATDLVVSQMGGPGYPQPGPEEATPDRPPVRPGGRQADYSTGVAAAVAMMQGIFQREASGQGCYIDVSTLESVACASNTLLGPYFGNNGAVLHRARKGGGEDRPMPQLRESKVPCKDGYLILQPRSYQDWQALTEIMGNPEWAQSEELQQAPARADYVSGKRPELWEWTRTQEKQKLYHATQRRRIVSFPINSAEDLVNSDHLKEREFFVEVTKSETGPLKYPGAPVKYSKTPWSIHRPAPTLGEHNHEVFCERLGISPERLDQLMEAHII